MAETQTTIQVPLEGFSKGIQLNTGLFYDGGFHKGNGSPFPSNSPHSNKQIASVHSASSSDVDIAVAGALKAFHEIWKDTPSAEKARVLYKLADLIDEHAKELAILEALDAGMMLALAEAFEVPFLSKALRYYAGFADKIEGRTLPTNDRPNSSIVISTYREPVGVCALILPFNVPLMALGWKAAAALAAGNSVIIKPSEFTSLSALKVAELTLAAGIPAGVFNVLPGDRNTGSALAHHHDIALVALTGSEVAGRKLLEASAASNLKRVNLELGGKNANIVFDDADLDKAAMGAFMSSFMHQGQICAAGERLFVQSGIFDAFMAKFNAHVDQAVYSDPLLSQNFPFTSGPSINAAQAAKVRSAVATAEKEGATVHKAKSEVDAPGELYAGSHVLTNVTNEMHFMREEVFGAVVGVSKFETEEEVIAIANSTALGLNTVIFTEGYRRANRVAKQLHAGTVLINHASPPQITQPFGGFKGSGWGKDGGAEALDGYLQTKVISGEL